MLDAIMVCLRECYGKELGQAMPDSFNSNTNFGGVMSVENLPEVISAAYNAAQNNWFVEGFIDYLNKHLLQHKKVKLSDADAYFYAYSAAQLTKASQETDDSNFTQDVVETGDLAFIQGICAYDSYLDSVFLYPTICSTPDRLKSGFKSRERTLSLPTGSARDIFMYGYLTGLVYKKTNNKNLFFSRFDTWLKSFNDEDVALTEEILTRELCLYVRGVYATNLQLIGYTSDSIYDPAALLPLFKLLGSQDSPVVKYGKDANKIVHNACFMLDLDSELINAL